MHALTDLTVGSLFWLPPLLVAPFIGSFLGVLIQRLPEHRPVGLARSQCDQCGHTVAARDLIPLLSFVLLRGRCRYCHQPIGWLAPGVELAALAVAGWAGVATLPSDIWAACLLGWALLALAWIDIRTMLLPDILTLPLLLAGLALAARLGPDEFLNHAMAAVLGFSVLFGIARGYRWLRGRDGMGRGDAKLFAALGAWIGLYDLATVLLVASCLGLLGALIATLAGRRVTATTAIPFGPFLAFAGWLVWLYA
ncbi:MAG: A24 family peptidase [Acetobacteraceae bacterium]